MKKTNFEDPCHKVRAFYEDAPFPGYDEFQTPLDLFEKAKGGIFAKLLDQQLPFGVRILDAGCGTGQLGIFLAMSNRTVVGIDFSGNSLKKGHEFKERFSVHNVHFFQMDLFQVGFKAESFDYVISNGVLHHTADAYAGFTILCNLVKKHGYIVVGLYNRYGRLLLHLRRLIFRLTGERFLRLDFFMRQQSLGQERKRIWYLDQYRNPHEESFTIGDVLGWFRKNSIEYVNSIPKINPAETLTPDERLFDPHDPGTRFDHFLSQIAWIFTRAHEGGLFIVIGRKR